MLMLCCTLDKWVSTAIDGTAGAVKAVTVLIYLMLSVLRASCACRCRGVHPAPSPAGFTWCISNTPQVDGFGWFILPAYITSQTSD